MIKQGLLSRKTFNIVWFGQLISLIGSSLTGFAMSVWIYKETELVSPLGFVFIASTVPAILASTVSGVIVDKFNRRWIMILSDSVNAVITLIIALLLFLGKFEVWHIYITTSISTVFNTFQSLAYRSSIRLLVPRDRLEEANGMQQVSEAVGELLAPLSAGFILYYLNLQGIIIIDLATFLFAQVTLLLVRFPDHKKKKEATEKKEPFRKEMLQGIHYLKKRPGLLALVIFFSIYYFFMGIVQIIIIPYVLSFTTENVLGVLTFLGGIGMLGGSLIFGKWKGMKRNRVRKLFIFIFLGGVILSCIGLSSSLIFLGFMAVSFYFTIPFVEGLQNVIVQIKVPTHLQGRVFAFSDFLEQVFMTIAYLITGPIIDYVIGPALKKSPFFTELFNKLVGTNASHAIALFFILLGCFIVIQCVIACFMPRLRHLEKEIPDVEEDETEGEKEILLAESLS